MFSAAERDPTKAERDSNNVIKLCISNISLLTCAASSTLVS